MTTKQIHIEKYDFDAFEKEQKPFTMIRTHVIQKIGIKHAQEFLLWVYLESLPETWKPNKTHLTHHFNISDRTYERYMSWLNSVGLIEYRQTRSTGGMFGKGRLLVLNGSKFNETAVLTGTVNIDGSAVNKRKKTKLSTGKPIAEPSNMAVRNKSSKRRAPIEDSSIPPDRQITEPRSNGAHINTIKTNRKDIRKTNSKLVPIFSDKKTIKNQVNIIVTNRGLVIKEEILNQIVFYVGDCVVYDKVIKKINIALKLIREGNWNIPHGYKGITSQTIREHDEAQQKTKMEQYQQEAKAFRNVTDVLKSASTPPRLVDLLKQKFKDELDVNQGTMSEKNIPHRYQAGG